MNPYKKLVTEHKKRMTEEAFLNGFLLGIRSHGLSTFKTGGKNFQRAFKATVFESKQCALAPHITRFMTLDPDDNRYHESTLMVLYGLDEGLIQMVKPDLTHAEFTISPLQAKNMLISNYERAITFMLCGERFKNVITNQKVYV